MTPKHDVHPETVRQVEQLAAEMKASGLAEDRQKLAAQLLDVAARVQPGLDKVQAKKTIAGYVANPDFLLFVSGAATLFGNVSYAAQFGAKAAKAEDRKEQLLNIMHTAIFSSFSLEKMAGIAQSGISSGAKMSRREALVQFASAMKHNYPMIAGQWHVANQVSSGLAFTAQAYLHESNKDAVTAGTRAMAATAATAMTLFKYHTILKEEKATGKKLLDDRLRKVLEPVDKVLGKHVDTVGGVLPYMSALMLTGPHASIFYNRLTDKENPHVSVTPLAMIVGYAAFVGYLSAKAGGGEPQKSAEKAIVVNLDAAIRDQAEFKAFAQAVLTHEGAFDEEVLSALLKSSLTSGSAQAEIISRAVLGSVEAITNRAALVDAVAAEYAKVKAGQLRARFPDVVADPDAASMLQGAYGDLLKAGVEAVRPELEGASCQVEAPKVSRRGFFFGKN